MDISQVKTRDLRQLRAIVETTVLHSVNAPEEAKDDIVNDSLKHINIGINQSDAVFLKEGTKTIRGFILIQQYWNLTDLFVLQESQGNGIGKCLFISALKECQEYSNKAYIRVNSSLNAAAFYKTLGFTDYTPDRKEPEYIVPLIYNF